MQLFVLSQICRSEAHCKTCRDKEGGRNLRTQFGQKYELPNNQIDFECPYNKNWGHQPETIIQNKPILPNLTQIKTFTRAMVKGKYVSEDIVKKRFEICNKCEFQRQTDKGEKWCGLCGCSVAPEDKKLKNLAAYEENLPDYGCKYKTGSKWKEAGL